jgi:hypothetical protein
MPNALGFHEGKFNPYKPGRLSRGRERWIAPWPESDESEAIQRITISGTSIEDDAARDSLRGVAHSGLPLARLITDLFPRRHFVGFIENGHASEIPDDATEIEAFLASSAGGRDRTPAVRWRKLVNGLTGLLTLLPATDAKTNLLGLAVLPTDHTAPENLSDLLYGLTGLSTLDSPPARFQPAALVDLLSVIPAIILFHRDKDGAAISIYTSSTTFQEKLATIAKKREVLLVPFSIAPMLARWDRALYEWRQEWDSEQEFPVPQSETPSGWAIRTQHRLDREQEKRIRAEKRAAEQVAREETDRLELEKAAIAAEESALAEAAEEALLLCIEE